MSVIWDTIINNYVTIAVVLARAGAVFVFNPIMNRRGVPNMVKAGLSLMMSIVIASSGIVKYTMPDGALPFVFDIGKELLIGAILGFFVNIMLQVFSFAGSAAENQMGLSMAQSYDPTFGNASIISIFYNNWFMLYFFAVGGHLSYIELMVASYETIPVGFDNFNIDVLSLIVSYFQTVLTLGLKLAMPIIASAIVTEFSIGVMMKAVPTIHVFVVNIQLKVLVGFVVLTASCGMISGFMDDMMDLLFSNLRTIVGQLNLTG